MRPDWWQERLKEMLAEHPDAKRIDTVERCEEVLTAIEEDVPHEELPPAYDLLVVRRNRLARVLR